MLKSYILTSEIGIGKVDCDVFQLYDLLDEYWYPVLSCVLS